MIMCDWRCWLVFAEISIGPHDFDCSVCKMMDDPFSNQASGYCLSINKQETVIDAKSDHEAVKVGMARIGEILEQRLTVFEGNPYDYPVIEAE